MLPKEVVMTKNLRPCRLTEDFERDVLGDRVAHSIIRSTCVPAVQALGGIVWHGTLKFSLKVMKVHTKSLKDNVDTCFMINQKMKYQKII